MDALNAYGGICACCGEKNIEFLTIDHVMRDGAEHRKEIGNGIMAWLKKNDYPSGFRILCWNCNKAIGLYGYCCHAGNGLCTLPDDEQIYMEGWRAARMDTLWDLKRGTRQKRERSSCNIGWNVLK